jgi:hypothetical protein
MGGLLPYYSVEVEMQTGMILRPIIAARKIENGWKTIAAPKPVPEGMQSEFDVIIDLWVRRAFRHSEEV